MPKEPPAIEDRLLYRVKRLAAALRAAVDEALSDTGLSGPQHGTLLALAANPEVTNAALARICFVTPQTMNELVQGLEGAKLVERAPTDAGGREIALRLTEEGRRQAITGQKRIIEVETKAFASFSKNERQRFLTQLEACAATLATGQAAERPAGRTRR
jgi:DNA-binding MarR family transcriptional regulator